MMDGGIMDKMRTQSRLLCQSYGNVVRMSVAFIRPARGRIKTEVLKSKWHKDAATDEQMQKVPKDDYYNSLVDVIYEERSKTLKHFTLARKFLSETRHNEHQVLNDA
ncbi:hypothetical protein FQA39_LY02818 [Lamprigera yunnana]|nr:hypothetical protein FQA39_LY02818 [Lamprigera yunnana]